jgi:hypothetical protein
MMEWAGLILAGIAFLAGRKLSRLRRRRRRELDRERQKWIAYLDQLDSR